MNKNIKTYVRTAFLDQRGQVLPWVAFGMVALLGMAGLTVDVGHAFVVKAQLQNSTNAAALAAANSQSIHGATVSDEGILYGANSGDKNAVPYVTGTPTITQVCLNMLMPLGQTCASSTSPINAVKVTQTASVPTYFMELLGINNVALSTTSLASMTGASQSWNIAIIEDATGSMATADTNCPGGSISEFNCALNSIQTILASVAPCPGGMSTCTPDKANVRVALFTFPNMLTTEVPKFYASGCSSSLSGYTSPKPYTVMTLPKEDAISYTPLSYVENGTTWTASYELTLGAASADTQGFVSDYYQSSTSAGGGSITGNLNPSSPLVELVGYGGDGGGTKTGSGAVSVGASSSRAPCMPISPGGIDLNSATVGLAGSNPVTGSKVNTVQVGEGITYYAAAIYAAQAALTQEHSIYPNSLNAIILLSDGQANTQWIYFPQGTLIPSGLTTQGNTNTSNPSVLATGSTGYSLTTSTPLTTAVVASQIPNTTGPIGEVSGAVSGVYPDFMDECQQAIVAGQYAASSTNKAGLATRVYAVAYGSEQTGCGSGNTDAHNDITLVTLPKAANVPFATVSALTPCMTMENIASSLSYFYSDYLQSGGSVDTNCIGTVNNVADLTQISFLIAQTFKSARLLPPNAS